MIEIKNLSFSYDNNFIIENLNVNFNENSINCILGSSGSGKSTLLNLVSGINKNYSGTIKSKDDIFSYVFQSPTLIPWLTVYENMHFALKHVITSTDIHKKINHYLNLVNLLEYKDMFPHELSGGMKQRVSLARAFAFPSNYLLMDEPFTGLNASLKKSLKETFLKLWNMEKKTVILVTHDIEEALELSKSIYVIKNKPLTDFLKFSIDTPLSSEKFNSLKKQLLHYL
ncbi:ABC transporter ATP-binding protein [Oceanirhabdus sp. W0125-5]|uniref:ABC transporter ATP-binding protein n=1 Tax=Oceanirhabdus sp. W0125-5 TaxID=2999116 RepID=UPI0022F2B1A5|nr:ABC transporter ATP-binding protein [Oceanirhabdus sp. W0125-5]WBW98300.1 ABC transporter ATP-binding protein [Oceanirhabdus sp. W0125-5]